MENIEGIVLEEPRARLSGEVTAAVHYGVSGQGYLISPSDS